MTTPDPRTPAKAVFYFRTLDRWPGGNADMLTVKVTLRLSPAPALEAQFYSCFDGRHAWYPPRRVEFDASDALAAFLRVTSSLAARGKQSLRIKVRDAARDEWDCEWAESEVLLFATDDAPETSEAAQLQLMRKVTRSRPSKPDPELAQVFELAHRVTGVGRVSQFSNTQDALSAAYRAQGEAGVQNLNYTRELTPRYLPPETDLVFVTLRDRPTEEQAAEAVAAAAAPRHDAMLVYRLDEVPAALTLDVAPDASTRKCLFYSVHDASLSDAMYAAVPEPEHPGTREALAVATRISHICSQSPDFARKLRPHAIPPGSSLIGGTYAAGFHGGDADAVERWLDERGIIRVPLRPLLDQLILLRLVDEHGAPIGKVEKFDWPVHTSCHQLGDTGLFVFERDRHGEFKLAPVTGERLDKDDENWIVLRASDFPPHEVHTVVIPTARAATKPAAAKKAATRKTASSAKQTKV